MDFPSFALLLESETTLLAMKAVGFIVPATVLSGVGVVAWQRKP